ncbi:MAG: pyridoxamine 5'-phosphate oxidase family protein [Pseudomonadales bacterium]|nr:pyridoxamine 5'-phosphate oxidase family protein [Pseudomonadales bacterium]
MYEPKHVVSTTEEIREVLGEVLYSQDTKCINHIDQHCRTWIEHSTFVVISSINQEGHLDVAPKGDPAGSWQILDEHTLAIPDRLGNNRADTFFNILDNPRVGLMFVVANRREVVRVSGSALIVKDPELLASMAIKGKVPDLAIVVSVEEAMFHCGKSMIRSNLWNPDKWASVEGLPTYGQALVDHGKLSISAEDMQAGVEHNAIESLY